MWSLAKSHAPRPVPVVLFVLFCQVMELDNRGSHFYLAMFWAEASLEMSADMPSLSLARVAIGVKQLLEPLKKHLGNS